MPEDDLSLAQFIELRGGRLAIGMLGVSLAVFSAVVIAASLPRDGVLAPVWLANAVVVAALAATPKKSWPHLLVAAGCGNFAAQLLGHVPGSVRLLLVASNLSEDCLAAAILRYGATIRPNLSSGRVLARLAGISVISGVSSAAVSSFLLSMFIGSDFWRSFETWSLAHILGLMTITPCLMIVAQPKRYLGDKGVKPRSALAVGFLLLVTAAVFDQSKYPILFLIPPALLLVSLELETFGAAAGVLIVEVFAIVSLYTHAGPVTLIHGNPTEKAAIVQVFLLACLAISLPVAALNAGRRQAMETARRSEEKYRLIAENAGDIIAQYAPSGEITFLTPSCRQVLGYGSDDLMGRRAVEMIHPDDVTTVRAYYRALLRRRGEQPPDPLQFRMQRQSGEWIWLEGQPRLLFDAVSGGFRGIQDVVRDVTSRKELEFKLSRAQFEAEAASVVKSEFMSNMSHELRTPLTSILGFASLLQSEAGLSEQSRRSIERIDGSSQALLAIVNDILDFSKLEAGQVEIQTSPTAIKPLLNEALAMLEPQAEAKGLRLTLRSGPLPECLSIASTRVVQVLTNLLGNAVKFTEVGAVTLDADYDPLSQRLRLSVADTGSGISDAGLARLFQRFSQVDGSTTRQFGGTGLGLAICKGLVDAMGGEIGASSVHGEGSVFWFEIPSEPAEALDLSSEDADGPATALSGLRVLVADGNRTHGEMVRLMLTGRGVEVTQAASGEEAAAMAEELPFDLILLDLRLSGLDGEAAARAIRGGAGPNDLTPILALTGDAMDREMVRTPGSPFDDCLDKPMVPEAFLKVIELWANPDVAQDEAEPGDAIFA